MWRAQMPALAAAGYRAVALSQRGYSAGARPDTREPANYSFDHLLSDAVRIAADCGNADRRLHLVGHDWGGSIAWGIADRYPARLASLTVLSRPHPNAFNRALAAPDGEQKRRSSHHWWFLEANAAERILADDVRWLRDRLKANNVPPASISLHISVLGNVAAMEAALTWYRARGAIRAPLGVIRVPTLFVWGDADDTVGRVAAEGTAEFVAAPYQLKSCQALGILLPSRFRTKSRRCCSRISQRIRHKGRFLVSDHGGPQEPRRFHPERSACWVLRTLRAGAEAR